MNPSSVKNYPQLLQEPQQIPKGVIPTETHKTAAQWHGKRLNLKCHYLESHL